MRLMDVPKERISECVINMCDISDLDDLIVLRVFDGKAEDSVLAIVAKGSDWVFITPYVLTACGAILPYGEDVTISPKMISAWRDFLREQEVESTWTWTKKLAGETVTVAERNHREGGR